MKKIKSYFNRTFGENGKGKAVALNEVNPSCQWVANGEGVSNWCP